jgi:hypothetical protein
MAWIVEETRPMASRLHLPLLALLAVLSLVLAGCGSDRRVCETAADGSEVCYYCDGLGCRPIDDTGDDPECQGDQDCDEGARCAAGLCQPLITDCTDDDQCTGDDEQCVAGVCRGDEAECTSDAQCADHERCSAGSCRAEDDLCQFNHECGSDRICIDGRCASECAQDTDCPGDDQVCDDGLCRCDTEGCVDDDHPRPFCTDEEGCAAGVPCVGGICRTPCDDHDACQRFDVQFTFCLEGYCATTNEVTSDCALSSDCDADRDCIDGICR